MGGWSLADQKLVSSRLDVDQPYRASDKPYIRRTLWIMFHWNQTKPHQQLIFSYQTKPKQNKSHLTLPYHSSLITYWEHTSYLSQAVPVEKRFDSVENFQKWCTNWSLIVKNDNYEVWFRATQALNRLSHLWILFFQPKFSEGLRFCSIEL